MSGGKVKIELNRQGVRKLLQSPEMMKILHSEGEKMGTIKSEFVGFDRCHVHVKGKGA